jgi:hypothetical protein
MMVIPRHSLASQVVIGNGFASSRIISLAPLTTKVMNEAFVSRNHPH